VNSAQNFVPRVVRVGTCTVDIHKGQGCVRLVSFNNKDYFDELFLPRL
jgi:hypothetical protein